MTSTSPHVETIVRLFAKKDKRERLLVLASKAQRWSDFLDALLHDTRSLDPSVAMALERVDVDVDRVVQKLGGKPTSPAYSLSAIAEIDDRELPLGDAIRASLGRERDTIVMCLATTIAFYENHEGGRFVLKRG